MWPGRILLGLALSLLVAVPCLLLGRGRGREGPDAGEALAAFDRGESTAASSPDRPYVNPTTAAKVRDLFGLNEGLGVPDILVRRHHWHRAEIDAAIERRIDAALSLGVSVYRMHTYSYPFNSWSESQRREGSTERVDRFIRRLQTRGLDIVFMVGPWPGNRTPLYTDRYVPDDLGAYSDWVRGQAERYDGDGFEDAPGLLRPVRWWEVDNEPDLHFYKPPPDAERDVKPRSFQTPGEYVKVLVASARAIHEAFPEACILNAGLFDLSQPEGQDYLGEILRDEEAARVIRVLSVHSYFEDPKARRFETGMRNARGLAGSRPVWLTETGVPSHRQGRSDIDQVFQARMLARVYGEALNLGLERVFWHSLADPAGNLELADPGGARMGGFSTHNLLQAISENPPMFKRKPAGEVYARLATLLGEVPLGDIERARVSRGGGCLRMGAAGWWVYKGEKVSVPGASGRVVNLLDGGSSVYTGAVTAPALIVPAS